MKLVESNTWTLGDWQPDLEAGGSATPMIRDTWCKPARSWSRHWTDQFGGVGFAAAIDESPGGNFSWRVICADPRLGQDRALATPPERIRVAATFEEARLAANMGIAMAVSARQAAAQVFVLMLRALFRLEAR